LEKVHNIFRGAVFAVQQAKKEIKAVAASIPFAPETIESAPFELKEMQLITLFAYCCCTDT
jgi:hypothetical protein